MYIEFSKVRIDNSDLREILFEDVFIYVEESPKDTVINNEDYFICLYSNFSDEYIYDFISEDNFTLESISSSFNKDGILVFFDKRTKEIHIKRDLAELFLNDSHRFVRLKAKRICS